MVLVVGVNSDKQANLLKGVGRPYIPENERAELVSAIRCVDLVTIFDKSTVEELILAIKPDFHAKGLGFVRAPCPGIPVPSWDALSVHARQGTHRMLFVFDSFPEGNKDIARTMLASSLQAVITQLLVKNTTVFNNLKNAV